MDDPRSAWQLWFPRNLTVQQVVTILRASRMGDQWQMAALVEIMLDSWPMLKKCQHELRSAVSQTKFSVHAYREGGKKPTKQAQEKADTVTKAMHAYRPNGKVTDERDFSGLVYDLADSYLMGLSVVEQQWQNVGGLFLPRTATYCHPAHVVMNEAACIQLANSRDGSTIPFDPNYFLSMVYQSQSGSVYAMGMVRSVGWWWAAMLATQQWMFTGAQRHGNAYTFLTYARDLMGNKPALDAIEEALQNNGANRYLMAPEGCTADMKPPGTMGSENPQRYIKEQADREVQQLFLGQTSSTSAEPGRLGNNDQHMEVRSERKMSLATDVGKVLTTQWATAICRRNFGTDEESPIVAPDFTEVESRKATADRLAVVINTGIPVLAEEVYDELNFKVPQEGDETIQRGQLGRMSNPAETPIQPTLEEQVEQQVMIAEAGGQMQEPVAARGRGKLPRVTASAYIGDLTLAKLPEDVQGEVKRFLPTIKETSKIVRYGMVPSELLSKVDPSNWSTATGHVDSQEGWDAERERADFEQRRDGKYILLMNDRIIDGHHFLAKTMRLGVTSSLNVLDLTGARAALKAKGAKSPTWITLR